MSKPATAGVCLRGTSKAASFSVGPPSTAGFGSEGSLFSPVRGCGLPGQNRVTPGGGPNSLAPQPANRPPE